MSRVSRLPLAVTCFALGAAATWATGSLHGQPTVPLPPPAKSEPLPPPAAVIVPAAAAPAPDPLSFRDVVKRVVPAVVNIEAKATARPVRRAAPLPPGVPEEFRRFFEADEPAPKPADGNLGFGSGVLVDPTGVVLTNHHVVEGADTVEVTLTDGRKFTSKDIRRDPKTDLAVVKIVGDQPFPALPFADSAGVEVGDRVLAVGAPFGLTGSVTHGIISAKSRRNLRLNQFEDFLQTDAAINPGNSGGPLVTLDAKVVGINAAIKSRSGGFQGVGLAISSNLAREVVAQLTKDGVVRRGYLGVGIRGLKTLPPEVALRVGVPAADGVLVTKVYENTPAARAGVLAGDVITRIGDSDVRDAEALPGAVSRLPIGRPVNVTLVRNGKPLVLGVVIEEQPAEEAVPAAAPRPVALGALGLGVADLTPDAAARLGLPKELRGVLVTTVERTGPAADAGLAPGRVVVKVDQTPVTTAAEFAAALAQAGERGALLHVVRPGGEVDFTVLRTR